MQPGQRIRDYIVEEKIGQGGMGEVWSAEHVLLHRKVALKIMASHRAEDPRFSQRFLREARSQAKLRHPHIVQVLDFFIEEGEHFLVLSLMSRTTLASRLDDAGGPLPVEEVLRYSRDVLGALDYAHQHQVIHRDVKPSNILIEPDGHAYLTDFGIALALEGGRLTRSGVALGTACYMSPEQIRSAHKVDHRTDLYSFGCVMYEMLAGRPPFAGSEEGGDTDFVIQEAHVHRVPEPIRTWNRQVPVWLDDLVLRALAKEPNKRFGGCGELREALDAPQSAKQLGSSGPGPRWRARPAWLLAAFSLLLAAAALLFLGIKERLDHDAENTTSPGVEQGFSDVKTWRAALTHRAWKDHRISLEGGYEYRFAGHCECEDFDMSLYSYPSSMTRSLAENLKPDNEPTLIYQVDKTAELVLRVRMVKCFAPSCNYVATVARRRLIRP